jgi:PAS domain-containing protein
MVYYTSIEELVRIRFLGSDVTVVEGIPSPLSIIGQMSLLVLAAYLVDATWRSAQRGNRPGAIRVGLSAVFFVLALSLQMMFALWGFIDMPIVASLFFAGILIVMGLELSEDMLRSAKLAEQLKIRESELLGERKLTDAIFESAPGMLYLQSADGGMVRWNSQHERVTGYSNTETARMKAEDFCVEEEKEILIWHDGMVAQHGTFSAWFRWKSPENPISWESASMSVRSAHSRPRRKSSANRWPTSPAWHR